MADTLSQEEIDALLKAMSEGELDESDMKKVGIYLRNIQKYE